METVSFERLDWGTLDYAEALARMRARHQERVAGLVGEGIATVEHPRCFTLGTEGHRDNILLSDAELADRGFGVYEVERRGDVTYHGPGQAVVYPIISVRDLRMRARNLVQAVERSIMTVVQSHGVDCHTIPDKPGIWVGEAKIAAIGMAIPDKVTLHGLALNVNTDLEDYRLFKACGLQADNTSLARELGREVAMEQIFQELFTALSRELTAAVGTFQPNGRMAQAGG